VTFCAGGGCYSLSVFEISSGLGEGIMGIKIQVV
jgi:hypothetical protein